MGDYKGKIIRTHNGTMIYPYLKGQDRWIETCNSRYDKVYHTRIETTGFVIEDDEIYMTTRMSYEVLREHFPNYEIINLDTSFYPNNDIQLHDDVTLRENQKNVMYKLEKSASKEIYLNVPTATGKTFMGIVYSTYLHAKTLIINKSNVILDQWEELIGQITVGGNDKVFRIRGNKDFETLLHESGSPYDYYMATPQTIYSFTKKHSWFEFGDLVKSLGIGLLIADEAHLSLGAIIKINASTNIWKTLYLSADGTRGGRDAKPVFEIVYRNTEFIRMSQEEMEDIKHIIGCFVTFNSHPNGSDLTQVQGGKYNWSHLEYSRYQFRKNITQAKVCFLINDILKNDALGPYKILILLQTIDQIDELFSLLESAYKDRLTVGKYYSSMKKEDKDDAKTKDIIISTYGSFAQGVNIVNPEIRFVISTIPVDEVTTNQAAGRCRPIEGLYSWIYMLYDEGFSYCQSKMIKIANYLNRYKIKEIYKRDLGDINGVGEDIIETF